MIANNAEIIGHQIVDVVIEAIFTNAETAEPAVSHCRQALSMGKHVITTNKGPIALYLEELNALAKSTGAKLAYEGTVLSGTPVIRLAKETLQGNTILGFRGIMNGTANFILGQTENGVGYEGALKEAQELGICRSRSNRRRRRL